MGVNSREAEGVTAFFSILMVILIILGVPMLLIFGMTVPSNSIDGEISPESYQELAQQSQKDPVLKQKLNFAMEDDKITYDEIRKIRAVLEAIRKEANKNQFRKAVGVTKKVKAPEKVAVKKEPISTKKEW